MEHIPEAELWEKIRAATENGLADVFKDEKTMPTKFILIAEVMDEEGERSLWRIATDGLPSWEALGMIASARLIEERANYG